jgi:NifB/MoaA-like Fe-S oxidoreductase
MKERITLKEIKISRIEKDSIAEDLGLSISDTLVSVNGNNIIDILDYKFEISDEYIELEIKHEDDEVEIYDIEKEENDDLGIIFEDELIDSPKRCQNKCIFCFMEQLPKHVRDTLIFKDDDYRLSFLTGNYITMTNMKESDVDRIIK